MNTLTRLKQRLTLAAASAIACSIWQAETCLIAQGRNDTVASTSGQGPPIGAGTIYSGFSGFSMNQIGDVGFLGSFSGATVNSGNDTGVIVNFALSNGLLTAGSLVGREGSLVPGSDGTYFSFGQNVSIGNGRQLVFSAGLQGTSGGLTDDSALYRGGFLINPTEVVRDAQVAPDGNGVFNGLFGQSINAVNQVAFNASFNNTIGVGADNAGLLRQTGNVREFIVRKGTAAPLGGGTFSAFANPLINATGNVAFRADLAGTANNNGLYIGNGSSLTQIVRRGDAAPDGVGSFLALSTSAFNDANQILASALYSGAGVNASNQFGLVRASSGGVVSITRQGQLAPDANGTYQFFGDAVMNESGTVGFASSLAGTSGGTSDNSGIFRSDGAIISQLARTGQTAPGGVGTFTALGGVQINNFGTVAFEGGFNGSLSGSGIFLTDGIDTVTVVRTGQTINGHTIDFLDAGANTRRFNDAGQVTYVANLDDGNQVLQRFTPDLHYRNVVGGSWDDRLNWTLGIAPTTPHRIFLDTDSSLTVTGPTGTSTTIQSLSIGGGAGVSTFTRNGAAGSLNVTNGVTVLANGVLKEWGNNLVTPTLDNQGVMALESTAAGTVVISGDLIQNGQLFLDAGRNLVMGGDSLFTGTGGFVGTGSLFIQGELKPGNSSAIVNMSGNLILNSTADTFLELGGSALGTFDQFQIGGNLTLDGELFVSMLGGYTLEFDTEYLVFDVAGSRTGIFSNFAEGSAIGQFGGRNLYITYLAGNGNDVALFTTAVPEPATGLATFALITCLTLRRTRRSWAPGQSTAARHTNTLDVSSNSFGYTKSPWTASTCYFQTKGLAMNNSIQLKRRLAIAVIGVIACVFLATNPKLFAQGRTETIAESGDIAPDGNGTFSTLSGALRVNNAGDVAYRAFSMQGTAGGTTDDSGIFLGNGIATTQIARENQVTSSGHVLTALRSPTLNDLGEVAFGGNFPGGATLNPNTGVFRGNGGTVTTIATKSTGSFGFGSVGASRGINSSGTVVFRGSTINFPLTTTTEKIFLANGGVVSSVVSEGAAAPDGNGVFSSFTIGESSSFITVPDRRVLNDAGQVAFYAAMSGTSGGGESGIFRADGGGIVTQIARRSQTAPDSNGTFDVFGGTFDRTPSLNDSGSIAFEVQLAGTSGGITDNRGIYIGNGGGLTQVARTGNLVPDGNGTFINFGNPELNNPGQAAFSGVMSGSSGGIADGTGVFRGNGGALTQISRPGQTAPDGIGFLKDSGFGLALNDAGQTVFGSTLSATIGGTVNANAILTSDGIDSLKVARTGDSLSGSTIAGFSTNVMQGTEQIALNQKGQVAYVATLADGRSVVERWTPDLHYRSSSNGNWDTQSNWTLGLKPADVHEVYFDPSTPLIVTGPVVNTAVRSLTVGGNSGLATLNLAGSELAASGNITIAANGMLAGNGQLRGDTFVDGTISPGTSAGSISILGNLEFGSTSILDLELGGLLSTEFDHLDVLEDTLLNGNLEVSLINGFNLSDGDEFLILDILGNTTGQFLGLGEGSLVGNFGGQNLYITYAAGNSGNGVALFSAVPEPAVGMLMSIMSGCLVIVRRRRPPIGT